MIWAIDRFGRSFVYNILDVADLDRLGVLVVSVKDSWLDTTSGMVRQILVGIFSAMARSGPSAITPRKHGAGLRCPVSWSRARKPEP